MAEKALTNQVVRSGSEHIPYAITNDALRVEQFCTTHIMLNAIADITLHNPNNKILDVGCGRGELLEALQAQGYQTYGCDMDVNCVELSSGYGTVFQANIEDLEKFYRQKYFDLIILSHVLEHISMPVTSLIKLMNLAKSGVLLAVPNPYYLPFVARALLRMSFQPANEGHWYSWDYSHLNIFAKRCGFSVKKWYYDSVALPFTRPIRSALGFKLLYLVEVKLLRTLFPRFCRSIIAHIVEKNPL
jgi:SAM-dependent methyltransferase